MKRIKILMIFLILHQISFAVPAEMEVVKTITRKTAMGVLNLGKYPTGGYITVKSLGNHRNIINVYQKIFDDSGVYMGINF